MGSKKPRAHLPERIKDTYGSVEGLVHYLDQAIEMLFYLEEDTFDRKEVQNVVAALKEVVVRLREGEF